MESRDKAGEHPNDSGAALISALGVTLLAVFLVFLVRLKKRMDKLPPGPFSIPLFNRHPLQGLNHHEAFMELAKTYGPVVRFNAGSASVVTANDYESVKECFNNNSLHYRDRSFVRSSSTYKSIGTMNGEEWRVNRQLCQKVMNDFNWGRPAMQDMLKVEIDDLCARISDQNGTAIPLAEYTMASFSNTMTKLLFGKRYFEFEDSWRIRLLQSLRNVGRVIATETPVLTLPSWWYYISVHIPFTKIYRGRVAFQGLASIIREEIKKHESSLSDSYDRDFLDVYIKRTPEHSNRAKPHLTMDNAIGNTIILLSTGIQPPSTALVWSLLICADKADTMQSDLQREIDEVIGMDRQPTWDDRHNMPLVTAFIWETHRWRPVNPIGLPRGCAEDTTLGGYLIPKGTMVIPNIWAVHREAKYWKNPDIFNPGRFLKKDGSVLIPKPDQLIPFSGGKRNCPGEAAASIQIFLYLTCILQKFRVLPEDGVKIDLSVGGTAHSAARLQKVRFLPRTRT